MLDFIDEFAAIAFTMNGEPALIDSDIQLACVERADKDDFLCSLTDIDKAARARKFRPEFTDV